MEPPPPRAQPARTETDRAKCIGRDSRLAKYTQFFALKSMPSFSICTPCYHRHVVATQVLVYEFEPCHTTDPEVEDACSFAYPSPVGIFHDKCIPTRTTQPLVDFVNLCHTLVPCEGAIISNPSPYYTTAQNAIPGFSVCPTCYECFFHNTAWESHFIRVPDGSFNGTRQWTCDLAIPFLQRAVMGSLSETGDFAVFVEEAKARMTTPDCPGRDNAITRFPAQLPEVIFTGKDGQAGNICFTCYCDCLANTVLENEFVPARLAAAQRGKITCDLSHSYSKMAMEVAVKRGSDSVWRESMKMTAGVGVCPGPNGVDERDMRGMASWYCVSGSRGVEVCANCYWLRVKLYGAGHLFEPVERRMQPGVIRICFLAASSSASDSGGTSTASCDSFPDSRSWRSRRLVNAMRVGYEAGDWSRFLTVARELAQQPPPCAGIGRGFTATSGRRWFGRLGGNTWNDGGDCKVIFCEECYTRAVHGRAYASLFDRDITQVVYASADSSGARCEIYTNRARGMLRTAADTGDLGSFVRWWNRREELRQKRDAWIPVLQAQRMKQTSADNQRLQQARLRMNAQRNALSRMGVAGTLDLASGDTGYRWGNSSVGWGHWTQGSAEAQQAWNAASSIPINVGGGNVAELQRLYSLAKADEEAFAAME